MLVFLRENKINENRASTDEQAKNSPDELEENSNNKRKESDNEPAETILKKQKVEKEEENDSEESDKNENETLENKNKPNQPGFDPKLMEKDPDCFECKQIYRDPQRKDLIMYLHALSYKVC